MGSTGSDQPKLTMGEGEGARLCADLAPGQSIAGGRYSVRSKRLVEFRNKPGQYLSLVLGDRTGDIQARVWDNAEPLAAMFEEGDVVAVTGGVETYKDQLQLIITDLVKCPPEQVRREDFLPRSERDPDEMMQELIGVCKSVRDPGLRKLLAAFFANRNFAAQFKTCPGAKVIHHAYLGGLIEHTLNVARICDNVCGIYPQLNRDLLIAGALLHDIGKVREYSYDTNIETTDEGRLIGHIANGYRMVTEAMEKIAELTPEARLRVGHLIVAHHGDPSMEAPKVPMTVEAVALHYAENLEAQVNRFLSIIARDRGQGKGWTEYDRLLDRRLFIGDVEGQGADPEISEPSEAD
jgi:3'-5' exoribonuclease